jgi:hypothetical protein
MKMIFPVLASIALLGCGNSGTVVLAKPPGPPAVQTVQTNPDCSPNWKQDVRDGFLALNLGPCNIFVADPNDATQHGISYTYTLTQPLHVTSIYGWNGTLPEAMEVGNRLKIDIPPSAVHPAGLHREYEVEYDKHGPDLAGEKSLYRSVNLTLPVGTIFTLERTEGIVGDCSGANGHFCALEFRWVFQED